MTEQDEVELPARQRDPLVIVVDAEYVFALERRLLGLERLLEGTVADALEKHEQRLGRHRGELEQLKGNQNTLGDTVRGLLPAAPAIGGSPL